MCYVCMYVHIYVTGFVKTILNGTLIKSQYKPFKNTLNYIILP